MKHGGASMFEELYRKPERLEQFMEAMAGISAGQLPGVRGEVRLLAATSTLCDVGGANGLLSMLVAQAHPHMRCISADLAAGNRDRRAEDRGSGPRRPRHRPKPLDFFAEPLPKADVITMGMILHDWNLEKKMHLVQGRLRRAPAGRRVRRGREHHRRRPARERLRPA